MFSCFTKIFQTHNIVVDPEFQEALQESSNLIKEQQKMIGAFIGKIDGLKENISDLKREIEALRKENAEVRVQMDKMGERMTDLSGKISTVIVEVFEEVEQEKKASLEVRNSPAPPTIQTSPQLSPLDLIKVPPQSSPKSSPLPSPKVAPVVEKVVKEVVEEVVEEGGEEVVEEDAVIAEESKGDYDELPIEVPEEELVADPEPVVPEPTVTKKGRGGGRSKKK